MIRINLLPLDVQAVEHKFNPNLVIGGVAGFLLVFLLPISWVQYSRRAHLKEEIISINNELERYKPIVAQVEILEQAKFQLQQRKQIIQQLENERLRYPYFMEDFLKLIPGNVWLTNLTTTLPADLASMTVSLDIIALDHYAVADLISNLETSQIFSEVEIGPIVLTAQQPAGQNITVHVGTTYRKAATNAVNANANIKKS